MIQTSSETDKTVKWFLINMSKKDRYIGSVLGE